MYELIEVVKVFDVESFSAGDGDAFRFRLEVICEIGTNSFQARVYRLETYRLQPTFPQSNGGVPDWKSDGLIHVVDEMFASDTLTGTSVGEVVGKFQQRLNKIFGSDHSS